MEFGSDFHNVDYPKGGKSILDYFPECNLYASGRQALLNLAIARSWKRLWVPSYFCEESLMCISRAGILLCRYNATPSSEPGDIVDKLPVSEDDGLLIVNYFGLTDKRFFSEAGCEIVEDHTHNLIGDWARNSGADWCISSLRKTLPIADGGMLWSPKKHILPPSPATSSETEAVMRRRFDAMGLKNEYLKGGKVEKQDFLGIFHETEGMFDKLPVSAISEASSRIVENMDVESWYDAKHGNWRFLYDHLCSCKSMEILIPRNHADCPFSFTLRFHNTETREKARKFLIGRSVYPAILWPIRADGDKSAKTFGDTMLSVHCDGRYSLNDMEKLLSIIQDSLN